MKKRKLLNKNSIPFLILAIIHFGLLFFIIKDKRKKSTWILLLSNIGIAYLFEYIVLNVFQAYTYKPRILKNRHFDNIFGAILSQGLFVPIASTFLTVFQKKWNWRIGFSFSYYCIEKLFIYLKIYKVNWWKPFYTLILLNVYFCISDCFYKGITNRKNWALKISHYLSVEVIGVTILYIGAVKQKIRFGRGLFHSWREHFIIAPLYSLGLVFLGVIMTSKPGMIHRVLLLLSSVTIDLLLKFSGILKINYKQCLQSVPIHCFMIFVSRFFYKFTHLES